VPEVSRFFGLVVSMYFDDHLPPHFHVRYAGRHARIDISSLAILRGTLPPRAHGLVVEWARVHRQELLVNWTRARARKSLKRIAPLE
jgi:hypothetical protein